MPDILRARIVLPFKLPTWNQILAMPLRQRMYAKRLIRDTVSKYIRDAGGAQMPMQSQLSGPSTDSLLAESYRTTRQSGSNQFRFRRKSQTRSRR